MKAKHLDVFLPSLTCSPGPRQAAVNPNSLEKLETVSLRLCQSYAFQKGSNSLGG